MVASGLLGLFILFFHYFWNHHWHPWSDGIHTALFNPIGCSIQRSAGEWKGEKKKQLHSKKEKKKQQRKRTTARRAHTRDLKGQMRCWKSLLRKCKGWAELRHSFRTVKGGKMGKRFDLHSDGNYCPPPLPPSAAYITLSVWPAIHPKYTFAFVLN